MGDAADDARDWEERMQLEQFTFWQSDSDDNEWEDMHRNIKPIADLETSHIQHIIRGLEAGKGYFGQGHKLPTLKKELAQRLSTTVSQDKSSKNASSEELEKQREA